MPWRIVSIYFDRGRFFCVDTDAVQNAIGDGLDQPRHSSDEDDADAEGEDSDEKITWDWQHVRFTYLPDNSSQIGFALAEDRLVAQRDDQTWPRILLPDSYHARYERQSCNHLAPPAASLRGDLALMIALVALTASPNGDRVENTFAQSIVGAHWQTPNNKWQSGCESFLILIRDAFQ